MGLGQGNCSVTGILLTEGSLSSPNSDKAPVTSIRWPLLLCVKPTTRNQEQGEAATDAVTGAVASGLHHRLKNHAPRNARDCGKEQRLPFTTTNKMISTYREGKAYLD